MGVSGWDQAKKLKEKVDEQNKSYVRMENDGDKVVGAIIGDIYAEEVFYNKRTEQYELFTKEHEAAGKKPGVKFYVNMYVIGEGNGEKMNRLADPAVRVLNVSGKTFNQLAKFRDKYGFDRKYVEIERNGAKGDTKTTYTVMPDDDIMPDDAKTLAEIVGGKHDKHKLHDLKAAARGDEPATTSSERAAPARNPKSEAIDELKSRLKTLPRPLTDKFLARFGITRIADLPEKDIDIAKAFVEELEGQNKNSAPATTSAAADPFA